METKGPFWSVARRKYLAGKLGELAVVLVAGGVLSDIFSKLYIIAKVAIIIIALGLLIASVPLYPEKEEEK